jgi:hypothetical protein
VEKIEILFVVLRYAGCVKVFTESPELQEGLWLPEKHDPCRIDFPAEVKGK